MPSIDTHLSLPGIQGESTHAGHAGDIEIAAWHWQLSNASRLIGGGSGIGKAEGSDFQFTHRYDKSSPALARGCAAGTHFDVATLTARKAGDGQMPFLVITLRGASVKSVRTDGSADGHIDETVRLSYAQIELAYRPQDMRGALGGTVMFGWDRRAGAAT